jgi:glutamyl-tRNA reductase
VSLNNNLFSSKPKQIAQAAIQILLKVYGDLKSVNFLVISDMKLPIDIAQNFENAGLNKYLIFQDPLEKIFNQKNNNNIDENLINKLKTFDLIMIGYKTQSKIIDKILVKKILNKRKQKPILFVDCGIPGNIKTDIGKIPNCFLFDLNDLEQLYSSWIQNNIVNEDSNNELFDIELKTSLDSFFRKLKFNLEQKIIFENKVNSLVKAKGKEIKFILKKFLKSF